MILTGEKSCTCNDKIGVTSVRSDCLLAFLILSTGFIEKNIMRQYPSLSDVIRRICPCPRCCRWLPSPATTFAVRIPHSAFEWGASLVPVRKDWQCAGTLPLRETHVPKKIERGTRRDQPGQSGTTRTNFAVVAALVRARLTLDACSFC
jgi:hypothetical protein